MRNKYAGINTDINALPHNMGEILFIENGNGTDYIVLTHTMKKGDDL